MTTTNQCSLFPADPKHGDIFELRVGLLYQYDATVNSWVRIVSSNLILPLVDNIADGAMSAIDLKKLNRLVIPPPRSTIIGTDCVAPFEAGSIGLFSGDNFINVEGDVSLQNIDSVGDVIQEDFPFQIHQHTYGYDFNLDIPLLVAELKRRGQLDVTGTVGPKGDKGEEGDPGIDEIIAGPEGDKGDQGNAPECLLTIETEPVQSEVQPGLNKALVSARIIDSISFPLDPTKYAVEFDRQTIGLVDASTSKFVVRQQDSFWILAVQNIAGAPQEVFYLDIEPLVEAVRQKFLSEVDLLKKGYEDIVAFWIQTMSDLFDEQKDALCCALECCKSRSKSTQLRQHMESVAAAAIPDAKINLHGRNSTASEEIPSSKLLADSKCYDPKIDPDEVCGDAKFPNGGGGGGGAEDETLEIDDEDKIEVDCDKGMDVVFVIDDSVSMAQFIAEVQSQVTDYVNHIINISGDDYRLGLITFKDPPIDSADVIMSPNNSAQFIAGLEAIVASGGNDGPKAHVEATQAAVDGFAGNWRPTKANIIITITDNLPSAGDAAASQVANLAKSIDIRISAIQSPNGDIFVPGAEVSLKRYAVITGGVFVKSGSERAEEAIVAALSVCSEGGVEAFSATLAVDPVVNAGSAANGASIEMPAGDYVATIKATSASINSKHRANIKLQYINDGQRKSTTFLDKGEFNSLVDGRHAYEGLTLPFTHDGGTASFYFPIIPQKQAAGEVQIAIDHAKSVPVIQKAAVAVEEVPKPKTRRPSRRIEKIVQVSDGTLICPMDTSHLRWYERGWTTGHCCGLVIDIGGQEYIVVKRSISDDACGGGENDLTPCVAKFMDSHGHPSFAWPTLDGKTFVRIPDVDQVMFRYDQELNDLAAQKISDSEYNSPKGNPSGLRHLTFQLMTILFPVA